MGFPQGVPSSGILGFGPPPPPPPPPRAGRTTRGASLHDDHSAPREQDTCSMCTDLLDLFQQIELRLNADMSRIKQDSQDGQRIIATELLKIKAEQETNRLRSHEFREHSSKLQQHSLKLEAQNQLLERQVLLLQEQVKQLTDNQAKLHAAIATSRAPEKRSSGSSSPVPHVPLSTLPKLPNTLGTNIW